MMQNACKRKKKLALAVILMGITVFGMQMPALTVSAASADTTVQEADVSVDEYTAQGEIITDVNVRKGPSTDYEIIGTVRTGDTVSVTGETHDHWYRVEYEGQTGYIFGDYVKVSEAAASMEPQGDGTENGEQPDGEMEPEDGKRPGIVKIIAIVLLIVLIMVLIFLTIRSMLRGDEKGRRGAYGDDVDDDYGDDDEDDESDDIYEDEDDEFGEEDDVDEDVYADEDDDADDESDDADVEDDDDDEEDADEDERDNRTAKPQTFILREEDYQLHIDPKYFEDEPVAQPECVTGYLKKKQEEEEAAQAQAEKEKEGDLQKAMDKLQELQEELERLKKNSKDES